MTAHNNIKSYITIVGVILLYWCVSWTAIGMNKWIYSYMDNRIEAPYYISFLQFLSPCVCLYAFSFINQKFLITKSFPKIQFELSRSFIRRLSFHSIISVFPLSILFCIMVTMSNLCLKHVEVSFYQISRSLGIPMIPLINYLLFGEKTSFRSVFSCCIIVLGYIMGIDGEINFSLKGTLFGLGASFVGTFYTIFLKYYLSYVIQDRWLLTFYNNLNSCFIIPIMIFVSDDYYELTKHASELTLRFYIIIFISGIVGLFVGITTYMQIQYTSSLSHNISGVVKNCIQSFVGARIFHTVITKKGALGIVLVVCGSITYAVERIRINNERRLVKVKSQLPLQIPSEPNSS